MGNKIKTLATKLLVVVIALAMVLSLAACKKEESKDEKSASAQEATYKFTEVYSTLFTGVEPKAVDATMSIELSDEALDLLKQAIFATAEADVDFSWINTTQIKLYANQNGDRSEAKYSLVLDGEEFAGLYLMTDMDKGEFYLKFDGISDKVIGLTYDDIYDDSDIDMDYAQIAQMKDMLLEILPSPETVDILLDRYINIVVDAIETETYDETVEVEGIKQKLSVTKIPVSEKNALNVLLPVLEKAKNDKEIKKIIENAIDVVVDSGLVSEDDLGDMDVYELLQMEVEDAIKELKKYVKNADDTEIFTVKVYTNDNDEICGIEAVSEGDVAFRWLDVRNGDDVATEISAPAMTPQNGFTGLKGLGTVDGNTLDITYEVIMSNTSLVEIDVTDYDMQKAAEGKINANIRIAPTDDLYDLIEDEVGFAGADYISALDPYVEFKISNDDSASDLSISVGSHNSDLIKISLNAESYAAKSISSMKADYSFDEMEEWAQTIDVEELETRLAETDFGEFILLMLTTTNAAVEKVPAQEQMYVNPDGSYTTDYFYY